MRMKIWTNGVSKEGRIRNEYKIRSLEVENEKECIVHVLEKDGAEFMKVDMKINIEGRRNRRI